MRTHILGKAISKHNARNQRAIVTVDIGYVGELWIEDLLELIEKEGSCGIHSLVKKLDEKYVTERLYENPKFVEDIVRDITLKLRKIFNFRSFVVECESYESIHNHNAYTKFVSSNNAERRRLC